MATHTVDVIEASVRGPHAPLLLPTSLHADRGQVTVVASDPGPGQVALALAIAGRVRLSSGSVTFDGDPDAARRRLVTALVDVPGVSEPDPTSPVQEVLGEELAYAHRHAGRGDVRAFLANHDQQAIWGQLWEQLPPGVGSGLLLQISASRPRVEVAVLAAPERGGGDPAVWWEAAKQVAALDLAVVVLTAHAAARLLHLDVSFEIGVK